MAFTYTTDIEFDYLYKILIIGDSGVGYVIRLFFLYKKNSIYIEKRHFYNDLHKIILLRIM